MRSRHIFGICVGAFLLLLGGIIFFSVSSRKSSESPFVEDQWLRLTSQFNLIRQSDGLYYSSEDFRKTEKEMNLPFRLPPSYIQFCNTFGPGTFKLTFVELFIPIPNDKNPLHTLAYRSKEMFACLKNDNLVDSSHRELAKNLIPFAFIDGELLCWNTKEINEVGEPAIYYVDFQESAADFKKVASDLYDLIANVGIKSRFRSIYVDNKSPEDNSFDPIKINKITDNDSQIR